MSEDFKFSQNAMFNCINRDEEVKEHREEKHHDKPKEERSDRDNWRKNDWNRNDNRNTNDNWNKNDNRNKNDNWNKNDNRGGQWKRDRDAVRISVYLFPSKTSNTYF